MKKKTLWDQMKRITRMKLIVPLLRSPHPPEYKARGVAVGLAWAMTPLVGIQMWTVFMTWLIAKKIFKWGFSLPLALAWTWVTNVLTMIPIYYLFYLTGQLMRWNIHNLSGYDSLVHTIRETFMQDLSFTEKWTLFFKLLLEDWGISMAVGCLPWAVAFAVTGYYLTMKFEQHRLERRNKKALWNKQKI